MLLAFLWIAIAAYLLGSIPVGYLLVRIFRRQDIRAVGSGNIGATNVLRTEGKALGAASSSRCSQAPPRLDRSGITGPKGHWLPWNRVAEVTLSDGKFVVREYGSKAAWWSGALWTPNGALLIELAGAGRLGELG